MIVECTAGNTYLVRPYDDARLAHVWRATPVRLSSDRRSYVPKTPSNPKRSTEIMLRRAGCRIIREA